MPLHRLLLPMIFIGGFIFHLFWEAKGQYTITYFVLLIPLLCKGTYGYDRRDSRWYFEFRKASRCFWNDKDVVEIRFI